MATCRRRCCVCFGLNADRREKKGQVAHLDGDPSNNSLDNLAFLCLEHHDQYDSRTSQSKGLTIDEVKKYRDELRAFVSQTMPPSDQDIVLALTAALDRPAFRTPFHMESSLPRFREAIAETIQTLNTGLTPQGVQLLSKMQIRDPQLRLKVEGVVQGLVALRAMFDELIRKKEIIPCGCGDPYCPIYQLSGLAARQMDERRQRILEIAHSLNPSVPSEFYDLD
jgi:hypothetical protein